MLLTWHTFRYGRVLSFNEERKGLDQAILVRNFLALVGGFLLCGFCPFRHFPLTQVCKMCNFGAKLYDVLKGVKSFSGCLRPPHCISVDSENTRKIAYRRLAVGSTSPGERQEARGNRSSSGPWPLASRLVLCG